MKFFQVGSQIAFLITLGNTFRVTDIVEDLTHKQFFNKNKNERQVDGGGSEIENAIFPIFFTTFGANLIGTLISTFLDGNL